MLGIFADPLLASICLSKVETTAMNRIGAASRYPCDVIVVHAPLKWSYLPFLVALRLRNPGVPMVRVEHHYSRQFEKLRVTNKRRFRRLMKIGFQLFDRTICVSDAQAQWLSEFLPRASTRMRVINPVTRHDGLRTLPVPDFCSDTQLRIGAFGRFTEEKGFDTLIRAFSERTFGRSTLLIGGYGEEEENLKNLATGNPRIEFYGEVGSVRDFLAACDILAIPSRREAFGLVAYEAREAGRPIIVSAADALPEQATGCGLVLDFEDIEGSKAAFHAISRCQWQRMAAAARASTFGRAAAIEAQWKDLLDELLPTKGDQVQSNCAEPTPFFFSRPDLTPSRPETEKHNGLPAYPNH